MLVNVIMWRAMAPVPLDDYRRSDRADAPKPTEYSIRNLHLCIRLLPRTSNPRFIVSVILERLTQLEFRNIMQFHTPNQTQTPNFSIYFGKPWVSSAKNVNSVIIYMQNYCVASKDVVHQLHNHFYGVFLAASVYIYPRQSAIDLLSTYVEESHVGLKYINDDRMHILASLFLSMLQLAFLLIVQWEKGHD